MQNMQLSILIIDDSVEDQELYRRFLSKSEGCDYLIRKTDSGEEGLKLLQSEQFHCILLDYRLPDIDGIELLKTMANNKRLQRIPKVFLTGQGNETIAVEAIKNGASDYLVKGELTKDLFLRTVRNVVDSKAKENILQEYFSFLETLIDTIPNPIFYMNAREEYKGCNQVFASLFGLNKEAIAGKTVHNALPPELAAQSKEMDRKLLDNPGLQVYEASVKYPDGAVHDIIFNKATFADSYGNVGGLVGIMHDITERKRMEANLRKAKEELENNIAELEKANKTVLDQQKSVIEEERLKLLLQLSGATAHELNQPLMAVLGNIEIIMLKKDHPKELLDRLNRIEKAGRHMAAIIRKIQSIRRDETIEYVLNTRIINFDQKLHVLSIEDSDKDFEKIQSILNTHSAVSISRVTKIEEAKELLKKEPFDLVLLDYILPDGTGFDFLRMIREEGKELPVVIITGQGNEVIASRLIQAGAQDYIPKQMLSEHSLSRCITNAMEKHRLKRDVQLAMKKMADMSIRDDLTGLYNRRYFDEALEREWARSKRYSTDISLCMVDLDHFKSINDTYGHPAGDKVLAEIGKILAETTRDSDAACRYGGEEFALILTNTDLDNAALLSKRFMDKLSAHQFTYDSVNFKLTASIGIASLVGCHDGSEAELVKKADSGLYRAKAEGRNRIVTIR